jgi:phosphoribosylformylglycinamidine (FGAM) synthase PurS component
MPAVATRISGAATGAFLVAIAVTPSIILRSEAIHARVHRTTSYLIMTITVTPSVIANPQGEAIHAQVHRITSYLTMTIAVTPSVIANPQGEAIHAQVHRITSYPTMTIAVTPSVIANPQGEAIHARTLDCFTLRVRNDGVAGRLYESSLRTARYEAGSNPVYAPWIASPCGFAMTGRRAGCMNRHIPCSRC